MVFFSLFKSKNIHVQPFLQTRDINHLPFICRHMQILILPHIKWEFFQILHACLLYKDFHFDRSSFEGVIALFHNISLQSLIIFCIMEFL